MTAQAALTHTAANTSFPETAKPEPARWRLKSATAPVHAHLDAQFAALDLRQRDDYRRFLACNAAALLSVEAALSAAGAARIVPDWPRRMRSHAILQDLDRLAGTARPLSINYAFDDAGMLGALYVLEGSRLGARVLLNTVSTSDDAAVTQATAYLRHGAGQKLWQSFLEILERHPAAQEQGAIEGALAVFNLFAVAAVRP